MPLIWSTDFHRESGEAERDGRVYRVRDRDGETVNEGGDKTALSLLSQVKQT